MNCFIGLNGRSVLAISAVSLERKRGSTCGKAWESRWDCDFQNKLAEMPIWKWCFFEASELFTKCTSIDSSTVWLETFYWGFFSKRNRKLLVQLDSGLTIAINRIAISYKCASRLRMSGFEFQSSNWSELQIKSNEIRIVWSIDVCLDLQGLVLKSCLKGKLKQNGKWIESTSSSDHWLDELNWLTQPNSNTRRISCKCPITPSALLARS